MVYMSRKYRIYSITLTLKSVGVKKKPDSGNAKTRFLFSIILFSVLLNLLTIGL
jgi:hypothetical protein